ncbi:MAG: GTPase domain-containing protein [Thermoplasmata archaeon]
MEASPTISKVLVVGPKGSGKTSLLCRMIYDSVDECHPVPGQFMKFSFSRADSDPVSFLFKEVNNLPTTEKKSAYILTLNSNNKADLESLPNILSMISDKKIIIALCMADLHYSAAFWIEDVKKIIKNKNIKIIPVSSKTGENIKQLMTDLSDVVLS